MTLSEEKVQTPVRAGIFARIAGFAQRRKWLALGLWVAVLVGVWGAATVTGSDYREDYTIPGAQSQKAVDLLDEHGSAQAGDTLEIVLRSDGDLRDPATRQQVETMLGQVAGAPQVAQVRSVYADPSAIAPDGRIGYATILLDGTSEDMAKSDTEKILKVVKTAEQDGLQVELGGEAARVLAESDSSGAEAVGIVAALVILVFMFGTLIAAGLPIVTAMFAVGSAVAVAVFASHVFTLAEWIPYIMALVGLGVGIDYALLIFARYRGELVKGESPERAATTALDAAGRTVFFAGCTVIVALFGLVALGLGSLRGTAIAVALTVLMTMIAAITLLPALLGFFGPRFARQFPARAAKRAAKGKAPEGTMWRRIGVAAQRRPLVALLIAAVTLGALCIPALNLRLGFSDAGTDASDSTSRKAYDLLADGFGPGFNGPFLIVVDGTAGGGVTAAAAGESAAQTLRDVPGIAAVADPVPTEDGLVATVIAFPTTAPQDEETSDLVGHLRGDVLPRLSESTGADYLVGGATAAAEDYSDKVADRMPLFILIVVGLSILLLMVVFRSILIPLKAAVLNVISIGASLGAMALVFQHGWFGVESGPIEPWVPVMLFAIAFGLSMDYEVFLVSRMHEEWEHTKDHSRAVREGLAQTGSVITAAGAIMVVVFSAFLFSPERALQQAGFGMAFAIFVDAVIIRCLIVPAAMQLMGPRAWWLPAPLARLLPKVELEKHG